MNVTSEKQMPDEIPIPTLDAPEEEVRVRDFQAALASAPKPVVTYGLIAINTLIFVAMLVTGSSLLQPTNQEMLKWGADFGPLTLGGQWWRTITSCFLHFNFIHIAMNMFILFQAGVFTEKLYGNVRFLLLYLLAGLGGSVVSLFLHPMVVSAGASGAVFGVYGGLLAFLVMQRGVVPAAISMGIAKSAGIFLVYNLIYGLSSTNVDLAAHGGGLVFGFLAGCALAQPLAVDGQRVYPIRTLMTALCGAGLAFAAITHLPRPVSARSVTIGTQDRVWYAGSATEKEALALGKALQDEGFFRDKGAHVVLSKSGHGTEISFVVRQGAWDDPRSVLIIQQIGRDVAPAIGGMPLTVHLVDQAMTDKKDIFLN